jgi:ABC-2 type transport system ATP-binding protein
VHIRGVTKTFGPKLAVQNLDLTIGQGSLCGFIGPNGAGKTTTIRMIMSIIFPDKGEVSVLGKASAIESKDRIGYLPEERGLYRKMKVGPFLTYMARLKGLDASSQTRGGESLESRVKTWLDRLGLKDCFKKKCEELSKGMQQKVQFIAAVLHEPDLIILDEVFSGLDPVNRRLMRSLIDEQHKMGRTIIFSTHAMFEAEQLCTHLFMIHKGNKVLDGTMHDVMAKYDPRVIDVEPMQPGQDLSALRRIPGVQDLVLSARGVELHLREHEHASAVLREAAQLAQVRRLEIKRPSLEDIFIQLVGGDAAALRAESEDHDDAGVAAPRAASPAGVES